MAAADQQRNRELLSQSRFARKSKSARFASSSSKSRPSCADAPGNSNSPNPDEWTYDDWVLLASKYYPDLTPKQARNMGRDLFKAQRVEAQGRRHRAQRYPGMSDQEAREAARREHGPRR